MLFPDPGVSVGCALGGTVIGIAYGCPSLRREGLITLRGFANLEALNERYAAYLEADDRPGLLSLAAAEMSAETRSGFLEDFKDAGPNPIMDKDIRGSA